MLANIAKPHRLNSRQHRFALNILAGMPPQQAYANAGYSNHPGNLTGAPYQIVSDNPSVSAFIDAHRAKAAALVMANVTNEAIASPTERKTILTDLLRAQLADFQDDKGEPLLTKDTPHGRAAKEYTHRRRYDSNGNEVVTKSIKLTDIISAIQELNKMDGAYAPRKSLIASKVVIELKPYRRLKEGPDDSQGEGF